MFQHKIISIFQNLSLGFILKIFLKFRKFQPQYPYKMYSYKKKRVYFIRQVLQNCFSGVKFRAKCQVFLSVSRCYQGRSR